MDNNHEPTANAEENNTTRARKRAWDWVSIISMFNLFVKRDHPEPNFEVDRMAFIFTLGLHENAEADMMESDLRESYIEFCGSKHGDQLARGIITHSEYWQEFARRCYGGDQ